MVSVKVSLQLHVHFVNQRLKMGFDPLKMFVPPEGSTIFPINITVNVKLQLLASPPHVVTNS